LAAVALVAIVTKQQQATADLEYVTPWHLRPLVAADALCFYLEKLLLPLNLCIHYPRRPQLVVASPWLYLSWAPPLAAGLVCWRFRKRGPWLAAAAWCLATLAPVLGLVPFAFQAYSTVADRYAYLAMFGPALLLAWGLARSKRPAAGVVALVGLCLLGGLSFVQASRWQDNETLFYHTLTVNPESSVGHNNWGVALIHRQRFAEALPHIEIAVRQDEKSPKGRLNLGLVLQSLGRVEEAIEQYQIGLADHPDDPEVRSNLGAAYFALRRYDEAIEQYEHALRLEPRSPMARFNLALAYDRQGKPDKAIAELRILLKEHPVHYQGRMKLGTLLASQGKSAAAIAELQNAVERFPEKPEARLELAAVLAAAGKSRQALQQYQIGMREDSPHWHWLAGGAALILAADPDAALRNGPEAVRLAEAACQRTNFKAPRLLQALAAAYAEVGQFRRAAEVAASARSQATGDVRLEKTLDEQLQQYRQGKTLHNLF
jgi:tetratricopeptide (TPR) repeat protein